MKRDAVEVVVSAVVVAAAGFLLASLVTALFVGMARETGGRLVSPLPAAPADVLLCALDLAGTALTAWLGLGVVTAALSTLPGAVGWVARGVADRVAPAAVRRGVAFLLGTTLIASFAPGTATGSPLGPHHPGPGGGAGVTVGSTLLVAPRPDLLPMSGAAAPDPSLHPPSANPSPAAPTGANPIPPASANRTSARGSTGLGPLGPSSARATLAPADRPSAAPGAPGSTRSIAESVVVRRGDSLWGIVVRYLGSTASAAEVATQWPRWYALNTDLIGDDPDLILPGQRLVAPSPLPTTPRAHTTPRTPTTPTDGASS